jgi:hypothetical protein
MDYVIPVDQVRIGDVIDGLFANNVTVIGIVNNKFMPRRVDLTIGDPDDTTMPTKMVTLNRNMLVCATRTS